MSRRASAGGGPMRKRRASGVERRRRAAADPDGAEVDSLDPDMLEIVSLELDPALVERIRARRRLRKVTLRVGAEQIEEARRVAARSGLKYRAVLRRWLAEGASIARTKRLKGPSR